MATLLSISDFPEQEFWTMLSKIPTLPSGDSLTDYDGDDVNNYLLEGDRKYRVLASEYNVASDNYKTPITENVKQKLIYWVSYCICRDAQEGKAIPMYNNIDPNKVDWWKIKKEDYLSLYESINITAEDIAEELEDDTNYNLSVSTIMRTS